MMARRMKAAKKTKPRKKINRKSYKQLLEAAEGRISVLEVTLATERAQTAKASTFQWRTRDHGTVTPESMTEEHLRNTVSFLTRRLTAQFGAVAYITETAYHVEALNAMLKEVARRGLRV